MKMEVCMKQKRRAKGMGRVYKENGVFFLQYTTKDHKRKAMILREENGVIVLAIENVSNLQMHNEPRLSQRIF